MKTYKKRIADKMLAKKLAGKGAVLIEGPKWCGKTTTAEQIANTIVYVSDPEKKKQYLELAQVSPKRILQGKTPVLIDEWQLIPEIWDSIRFEVDHRDEFNQFVLTGSSVPPSTENIFHSGTGRFAWLTMRTMSLYESLESNGSVSLKDLFDGQKEINGRNELTLEKVAFLACRGGWPRSIDLDDDIALQQAFDYYDAVVKSDISKVDGISRNEERAKRLMSSLARNQGSQCSFEVLCDDINSNDYGVSEGTISSYIAALKKIFVIEDMPAWNPNLRSKTAIRTSDTRYFVDPSIATAALGLGPNDLLNDLNTFGFIFETLCVRDLRVYADALDGKVYHYRDKTGLECDAVIHLRNGSYGLIEIKLGGESSINEAVTNLTKLANKIDINKMKSPSFLLVLTAIGDYAYRREDGIYVVPIGCLKD